MILPWRLWMNWVVIYFWSTSLAFRTSNDNSGASRLRLMTKTSESEALPRRGPAIRENDIAAIFKGVAYGAPTLGPPNASNPFFIPSGEQSTPLTLIYTTVSNEKFTHETFTSLVPRVTPDIGQAPERDKERKDSLIAPEESYDKPNEKIKNSLNEEFDKNTNNAFSTSTIPAVPTTTLDDHLNDNSENKTNDQEYIEKDKNGVIIDSGHDSHDLRWSLGLVWWVHVYLSIGLFTSLAILTLCLASRFVIATHLLPRPHYLALHILIFFTAFFRSFHTLHDAHTLKYALPVTILTTVEEIIWPCLIGALAVILVAVLKEWRYPRHPHLALALGLVTFVHLITLPAAHIAAVLLKEGDDFPIKITTRAVTAAWSGAVGIGGMWAVWRESKDYSSHMTDIQCGTNQSIYPSITHAARLVFTATVTQLILTGINIYTILVPVSPDKHIWVWWCCITISRSLELIVAGTLMSAAALTLDKTDQCSIFKSCCQKRTVEIVHPTEIKMIHPMGVYTLQPARPKNEHAQTIAALSSSGMHKEKRNHNSLDYVTSDFQLVWNLNQQRQGTAHTDPRLIKDDMPRAHILPVAPRNVMEPFVNNNAFPSTLPRNRIYTSPQSVLLYEDENVKSSQDRGINYTSKSSTLLSESSGSSRLYASPQIPLRTSRSWDELSTGHVYEDPMKVKPGSVDEGLSDLSDMNSDHINDLFLAEANSPVVIRPKRRSRRRHNTACYLNAKHFTMHQPSNHSSAIYSGQFVSRPTKSSDFKSFTHQNSFPQAARRTVATQKSLDDYSTDMAHPIVMPPTPFLSSGHDTTMTTLPNREALPPPSTQSSSTRHIQTSLTRSKTRLKSNHHEGY